MNHQIQIGCATFGSGFLPPHSRLLRNDSGFLVHNLISQHPVLVQDFSFWMQ
jgi:hypothetical protein